jgi:exosortase
MSAVNASNPDTDELVSIAATPWLRFGIFGAILMLTSSLPFLFRYASDLWCFRSQYVFLPIVPIGVVFLLWRRWPVSAGTPLRKPYLEFTCLVLSVVILATSVAVYSLWLGGISAVFTVAALLLHFGGKQAVRELWPVWGMLWLPLVPSKYAFQLIDVIGSVSPHVASRILDLFGIGHIQVGNIFELPGRELFMTDALGGIHAEFVLVVLTVIFATVARRTLFSGSLLIVSAFVWATIVNIGGIVVMCSVTAETSVDLSSGWRHDGLGGLQLALGILLVLSTDQLIHCFLLGPIEPGADADGRVMLPRNPLARWWNRRIARVDIQFDIAGDGTNDVAPSPWRIRTNLAGMCVVGLFCALGLLQVAILSMSTDRPSFDFASIVFNESSLPAELKGWQRVGFETKRRKRSAEEGEFSQIWRYDTGGSVAQVSLDYPFLAWNEATACYQRKGWTVNTREFRKVSTDDELGDVVEVQLSNHAGEYGHLLFSLYNHAGHPISPEQTVKLTLSRGFESNPLLGTIHSIGPSPNATSIRIQQFVVLPGEPSAKERQKSIDQFLKLRSRLREHWLHVVAQETSPPDSKASELGSRPSRLGTDNNE